MVVVGARESRAQNPVIVVHGGAGTIEREAIPVERQAEYRRLLREALRAGYRVLEADGSSSEAVETAIRVLEEAPLFNAGRGSVLTGEGTVEMDASIMDGRTRQAGAVTGVQHAVSPIALARLVMERSPHVMLAGEGADAFARQQGLQMKANTYFQTERRRRQLERQQQRERGDETGALDHFADEPSDTDLGTVGAVALDRAGNLAAGTSTGGMTNKQYGRVGDSPIIGAGTYADNRSCAVSGTGHGEYFIRGVVAHDIAAMMRYGGRSVDEAARAVVHDKLEQMGGSGGVIALDRTGRIAMPFNTPGMFRGYIDVDGEMVVRLFGDE